MCCSLISGNNPMILEVYRCPTFKGVIATTSGLSADEYSKVNAVLDYNLSTNKYM